ncbi:hypothetical protein KR222_010741, partial [Zaprionus bogoriensis]
IYDFSIHEEPTNSTETEHASNSTNSTRPEPKVSIWGSWTSSFLLPGNDSESEETLFVEKSDITYDENGYHGKYNISEYPRELDERLGATALKVITG